MDGLNLLDGRPVLFQILRVGEYEFKMLCWIEWELKITELIF